ncbi:hypothetical protein VTJ04DRAFT_3595 [Mycothermus thermophilus]|uniref:uncharacterized protein n=1 Tax=Humicola insolens TaxID=85995 RepID=UPI0037437D7F
MDEATSRSDPMTQCCPDLFPAFDPTFASDLSRVCLRRNDALPGAVCMSWIPCPGGSAIRSGAKLEPVAPTGLLIDTLVEGAGCLNFQRTLAEDASRSPNLEVKT